MTARRAARYGDYLRLDAILDAQRPPDFARLAPGDAPGKITRDLLHHDELLFIVTHQTYELWFKLVLHELTTARDLLAGDGAGGATRVSERDVPRICHGLERVNEIFRIAVDQFRVIETMAPTAFLAFRDAITPASGFQSFQFRELEILAGLPEARRVSSAAGDFGAHLGPSERARIEARLREPTLRDVLFRWLTRTPIEQAFPDFEAALLGAFDRYADAQIGLHAANPALSGADLAAAKLRFAEQKAALREYVRGGDPAEAAANRAFIFITTFREEPLLRWPSTLLDRLVEFEQAFRLFRFRHARMVERMIGARTGSGGSPGVAYLDQTTGYRIFGSLLDGRNFLLARERLPALPHPEVFRFRFEE